MDQWVDTCTGEWVNTATPWLPFLPILCFLHVSSVSRSCRCRGSELGKQKAHQGPVAITLLLVSCQPEDVIRTSNKEDEIPSFTQSILLQGMRQKVSYLGEESHFIQPGNIMAGVCWERQGERDECGYELFTVTIGKKMPAHQLILTNTTKLWQIPQRPASGLSFWHVNWKLESLLEEVKSLHFHDSTHGKQKPRHFIGPRKRPWPLTIPFSGTPGHSARGRSASPTACRGTPCVGRTESPLHGPARRCSLCTRCHAAAETHFVAAETGPTRLTMCPLSDAAGIEAGTFLPLSSFLFFPLFPPVPLSSSTQTRIAFIRKMRGMWLGTPAWHLHQCTLVYVSFTKQIRNLMQKQTFLKSIFQVLFIMIHSLFLIYHCLILSGLFFCTLIVSITTRRKIPWRCQDCACIRF